MLIVKWHQNKWTIYSKYPEISSIKILSKIYTTEADRIPLFFLSVSHFNLRLHKYEEDFWNRAKTMKYIVSQTARTDTISCINSLKLLFSFFLLLLRGSRWLQRCLKRYLLFILLHIRWQTQYIFSTDLTLWGILYQVLDIETTHTASHNIKWKWLQHLSKHADAFCLRKLLPIQWHSKIRNAEPK